MPLSNNPYQPPTTEKLEADFDGRLRFSGTMDADDYRELLPSSDTERFGWAVFESPVLSIVVPIVVATSLYELVNQTSLGTLLTIATLVLSFCLFVTLQRLYSRRAITARQLKRNPDLLGLAQGEFSIDGLLFHDGTHHYWFGPAVMGDCVVTRRGMRVRVDSNPYRFLALTAKIFDNYDFSTARQLLTSWKKPKGAGRPASLELWNQVGSAPEHAIEFRYAVQMDKYPAQPVPQVGMWDLFSLLFLLSIAVFNFRTTGKWILLGYFLFLAYSLLIWPLLKRRWSRNQSTHEFTQFGWITVDHFATHNLYSGLRLPTSKLQLKQESEDLIVGSLQGLPFHFSPSILTDPNDWQRLCELAAPRP